jgi:hypothetical protein
MPPAKSAAAASAGPHDMQHRAEHLFLELARAIEFDDGRRDIAAAGGNAMLLADDGE